jgi:uncharacterized protein YciI
MYFLCKLVPPRPGFPLDMSPSERDVMTRHVASWMELLQRGKVIAFGPVADPAGGWGMSIVSVADEAELRALQEEDPAIRGAIGMRYETCPMPRLVHKGQGAP